MATRNIGKYPHIEQKTRSNGEKLLLEPNPEEYTYASLQVKTSIDKDEYKNQRDIENRPIERLVENYNGREIRIDYLADTGTDIDTIPMRKFERFGLSKENLFQMDMQMLDAEQHVIPREGCFFAKHSFVNRAGEHKEAKAIVQVNSSGSQNYGHMSYGSLYQLGFRRGPN